MAYNISYFAPSTNEGNKLYEEIKQFLNIEINVFFSSESTQADFIFAVHQCDIVIVDCTIPDVLSENSQSIYPLLTAQVNMLDHIIVISKSQLPLNITPYRGVYPIKDTEQITDKDILFGIRNIIPQILKQDIYPRIHLKDIEDMILHQKEMENMWKSSFEIKNKRESTNKTVMISYRNNHSQEVEEFKKSIVEKENITIKVLPPASLCGADEAHTPMRRWMLVGILEDNIREVKELWVYETDNYLKSWWTIAELVMVAYLNYDRTNKIEVKVYNPSKNCFYEKVPKKYNVVITKEQHRRLARFLSNTRPDTMGPECLEQVGQLKQVASLLRAATGDMKSIMLDNLRNTFELSIPKTLEPSERQKMIDSMIMMYSDPDEIERYANDDVFQSEFWHNISYQTAETTPAFKNGSIDIDTFMKIPMDELTDYVPTDFLKAAKESRYICMGKGKDKKHYSITFGDVSHRYLWLATRMGQPTTKQAPGLEEIDVYNIKQIDE